MSVPPTTVEADAAVPVAGTPSRSLVNAFFKDLVAALQTNAIVAAIDAALGGPTWQSGGSGTATFAALAGAPTSNTALNAALRIDSMVLTANAMAALDIDTTKALNTKSLGADSTLTFSGTPPVANTYFGLALVNSVASSITITIPSSYSEAQQDVITSFVMPPNAYVELVWKWDGAQFVLRGEPVLQVFQAAWSIIGTTTARDYPVILKTKREFVVTAVASKCASGTATATVKIDGVALGGTANAVSSTEVEQAHASANTAAVGTDLAIGFTAGAVDPQITISGFYL